MSLLVKITLSAALILSIGVPFGFVIKSIEVL